MILYFIVALAVGVIAGMLGIGGGVIIVPLLVSFFLWSEELAQGTTLAMLLPPVGLLAVWQYYRAGEINIFAAVLAALIYFPSAYFGSILANVLPAREIEIIFGIFAILTGLKFLWPDSKTSGWRR
jgi:hypothetical protein